MTFIKHGDAQPITQVISVPEVLDEAAKESLEKAKKASLEEQEAKNKSSQTASKG